EVLLDEAEEGRGGQRLRRRLPRRLELQVAVVAAAVDDPAEHSQAAEVGRRDREGGGVLGGGGGEDAAAGGRGVEQPGVGLAGAAALQGPVEDEGAVGEEVDEVEARQTVGLRRLPVEQN